MHSNILEAHAFAWCTIQKSFTCTTVQRTERPVLAIPACSRIQYFNKNAGIYKPDIFYNISINRKPFFFVTWKISALWVIYQMPKLLFSYEITKSLIQGAMLALGKSMISNYFQLLGLFIFTFCWLNLLLLKPINCFSNIKTQSMKTNSQSMAQ